MNTPHYGDRLGTLLDQFALYIPNFCRAELVRRADLDRWISQDNPRLGKTFLFKLSQATGWSITALQSHLGQTAEARKIDAKGEL